MAFQVEHTGRLQECLPPLQVGDLTEHGVVMRVQTLSVADFIGFVIGGGLPMYGYDEVILDERFVISTDVVDDGADISKQGAEDGAGDDDISLPSIIGGEVTVIWVNAL